ncbi:M15 family metallopeptidase [Alishewanella longhuensis]
MLYSALPGASRHHWGTELDIYDAAAVPADYQPQLLPAEYASGGPFYKLAWWLECHAAEYGFFLPYKRYQGGVAAEPWHISYQPLAKPYQAAFSFWHCYKTRYRIILLPSNKVCYNIYRHFIHALLQIFARHKHELAIILGTGTHLWFCDW